MQLVASSYGAAKFDCQSNGSRMQSNATRSSPDSSPPQCLGAHRSSAASKLCTPPSRLHGRELGPSTRSPDNPVFWFDKWGSKTACPHLSARNPLITGLSCPFVYLHTTDIVYIHGIHFQHSDTRQRTARETTGAKFSLLFARGPIGVSTPSLSGQNQPK